MGQICLDPKFSRYINVGTELKDYLKEKYKAKYGSDVDFKIEHQNERWYFNLPDGEEMTEKQLSFMTNEIVERQKAASVAK